MEDKLIIKNIKKQKEKGMEMLIDEYGSFITSIVRRTLANARIYEEECIDDVLLSIWNNIEKFDSEKNSFKNWIGSISKYRAINYRKKYANSNVYLDSEAKEIIYIDKDLDKREIEEEVDNLISTLSYKDAELFRKYYLEDVSLKDIAVQNETTVENLHNRLSRGRKKMRLSLSKKKA
ncbi:MULTISPECIES: sigma-70 family RNA polymerase sigma factor [unclassified Clostridioides]|uniref:sigma-70 family RNA polymerase sigma factor n=1 Tax=unclassified Clostridioides TaxID=2635829 RepID=UPI001D10271E|nr:sigma-70 family RNA polymerase sigma factor [Clostridioides sp. ES-S-0171-01]MCC0688254.1 sigma-70 family RNA polymerase sigma factor [Clostridioides sp. ES-S-0056-01]MCC0715835.1 sigma-70 family RNA polymerase sigma factor [Clostridioides sp. ES-S-0077-01]UDN54332.1 sigma-70 family RNA polymerase sigma factor [Clostridioides sp. ES-S-0054-01]